MGSVAFSFDLTAFKQFHEDIMSLADAMSAWEKCRIGGAAVLKYRLRSKSEAVSIENGFQEFLCSVRGHHDLHERIQAFEVHLVNATKQVLQDGYSQFRSIEPRSLSAHGMAIARINMEVRRTQNFIAKHGKILPDSMIKDWTDFQLERAHMGTLPGCVWSSTPQLGFKELRDMITEEAAEIISSPLATAKDSLSSPPSAETEGVAAATEEPPTEAAADAPLALDEAADSSNAAPLPEWAWDIPRKQGALVRYLWGRRKKTASFDDLHNDVWGDSPVQDDAIDRAVTRANEKLVNHGYTLSISNRRVQLKTIR